MNLPSRLLLSVLLAWLALGIAAAVWPALGELWRLGGAAILLWCFADFVLARWQALPAAQRVTHGSLPLGEWSHVEIRLHWSRRAPARVEVFDHTPAQFAQEGMPSTLRPRGENTFVIRYRIRPLARGKHQFGSIELRQASPLRAWQRQSQIAAEQPVRVYPNFAPLARAALRAADHRDTRFGVHQRRRRGQGMDFAQLREYREGDSLRQIDWKATTRMGKMISREYQDERDQRILLLVDCGRRMGARDGELSHFDHALNATIMLAWVALRHGDRVGLMTLGGPERSIPAQRSPATISHILHALYDLEASEHSSDFERAAQQLLQRERKRSLVVLLTNLRDEEDRGLLAAARLLSSRHLVLVASLREEALDQAQAQEIGSLADATLAAAAASYRRSRNNAFRRLRAEGILCLDTTPGALAVETINQYLAVKSAGRL